MKESNTLIDKNRLFELVRGQSFDAMALLTPDSLHRALDSIAATDPRAKKLIPERLCGYFKTDAFTKTDDFSFLVCGLSCAPSPEPPATQPPGTEVPKRGYPLGTELAEVKNPGDGALPSDGGAQTEFGQPADSAWGAIAPFAQKNYYREAVLRLKKIVRITGEQTGFDKTSIRIFCNSGAPEKFLASAAGLGWYGKNSLIINPALGSNFILAGILFPFTIKDDSATSVPGSSVPEAPGTQCGNCRACVDACPTQAIRALGRIDTTRCIQALATELVILPDPVKKAFGNRIYGCQVCQEVCPYNRKREETGTTAAQGKLRPSTGEDKTQSGQLRPCGERLRPQEVDIGPRISLKMILSSTPEQLKAFLKGSVPGSSWIDMRALQRNALLAAGNLKSEECLLLVSAYLDAPHPALSDAARWAEKQIRLQQQSGKV